MEVEILGKTRFSHGDESPSFHDLPLIHSPQMHLGSHKDENLTFRTISKFGSYSYSSDRYKVRHFVR